MPVLIAGFALGIVWRSFFEGSGVAVSLFVLLIALAIFAHVYSKRFVLRNYFLFSLFLISFGMGMLRFDIGNTQTASLPLNTKISLTGIIVEEPDAREKSQRLTVGTEETGAKILITTQTSEIYAYGDKIHIEGKVKLPERFETDSGREFDYPSYLKKDGIEYVMAFPEIEKVGEGFGNPIKSWLLGVKHVFMNQLSRILPSPQSSLLAGLLIGAKQSLPSNLIDAFKIVGLIHIIVLSGYNISLVAEGISKTLSRFPRKFAITGSVIGIILFAIMTGASATVVRASIMALLIILARTTGRVYDALRALIAAGILMIVHNPRVLVFDPSFQLSFMATLGLLLVSPILTKHFFWVPKKYNFREIVVATVSTQLFLLPFLIYTMGNLSLISLPANFLVLIFIPLTMFSGFAAVMVSFISEILALPLTFITHFLLSYEIGIANLFSKIPYASISIPQFSFLFVIVVYAIYVVILIRVRKNLAFAKSSTSLPIDTDPQ